MRFLTIRWPVHLFNPLWNAAGGSEWRTIGLYRELEGRCEATLWSSSEPDPLLAEEPHVFLQGLDCFFYRTAHYWTEPWGRIVPEAMAYGLPVVSDHRGGYRDMIQSCWNGFLFEDEREALEILMRLKEDRPLRDAIGGAAHETVRALFSPERRRELADFYMR